MKDEDRALLWMIAGAVVNNSVALRRIEEHMFPERFRDGAEIDIAEEGESLETATKEACGTREQIVAESGLMTLIRREGGQPRL